jgi:hypothetical protein
MASLIDLSAANHLLHLREGKTLVPLPGADPVKLALTLAGGGAFAFEAGCDPAVENGWLRVPLTTPELERRLTAMRRAAKRELAERGLHVLWLALGSLTWLDADGVAHTAPLALWPAELEHATGAGMRLVGREGIDPRINQALVAKLARDVGVVLAVPGDDDPEVSLDLLGLLDAAEGIAVTRPGWKVERTAHLGVFALDGLAMWADLERAEATLVTSPVLAHLANAERGPFGQPSIAAAEAVTRPKVVADVLAPLDADASQLAAVAAAAHGASFVLQAAPGTGSSQTIANVISHCISHGKTVLFVSDHLAALEVVRERLSQVGLGEFCLGVASAETSRQAIVAQLGRVFDRAFRPGTGPSGDDARLAELRTALDVYVAALHRVGPFGRSVHDVLGRLVELRTTPRADLAERDAVGLDRATFERRKAAVTRLAEAAVPVEPVATHPWRASTIDRLPDDGQAAALAALDAMTEAASSLAAAVAEVGALVPSLVASSRDQLVALGALAALAAATPRPGAEMLTHIKAGRGTDIGESIALIRARGTGSVEVPRDPLAFLQLAHRHRQLATEVEDGFTDSVEGIDANALWTQLRKWTTSMGPLRYVALRNVRAEIKAAAMPAQLDTDGAMISALEAVMAERACRAALLAAAEPAKRWFGELGGDPLALDLGKLDAAVGWSAELRKAFDAVELTGGGNTALRATSWRALVAQVAAGPSASVADLAPFARLAEAVARWQPALANLAAAIGIDAMTLGAGDDHLAALTERAFALRLAIESLPAWVAFHAARHGAIAAGIGPAVAAIERGDLGAAELAPAWERATLLAWGDAELTETPALAQFHGASHHAQVSAFADLDRGALALSRARALVRLADRVPRITGKLDAASKDPTTIELGVLMAEMKKPRGHKPLRTLFAELPTILPRLAPCMLMTPSTVAQYLDPALPRFDVVIFDEASRLPTAAAIGSLGRAASAIIVGDAQQLGPVDGAASLLEDCIAAKLPELALSWQYRSKHEDVFAFANQRYYGDRLQLLPAPQASPDLGVAWRRIDGTFDRDGTEHNRVEAEAVVAEALARLRDPIQRMRSLGIIAGSPAQADLIEDLIDAALLGEPSIASAGEPLVIKDLTALGVDDRDVILLSIGYGPAPDGVMTMNLGALSEPSGTRALASALTRAREQIVVFSSFAPEDLHDDAAPAVRDLAAFLGFARAGGGAGRPTEGTLPASPITAAIARALGERGWTVRHQVGCGAYKLDLAVVDPSDPERYVLAIEHDGPAYATASVARDRDRLRAQILTQLGWRLHRIWGLDWWADPEREIQRAHGAIVTAIAANRQRRAPIAPTKPPRAARASGQLVAASGSAPVVKIPPRAEPVIAAGSGPTEATPLAAYEGNTTPTRIKKGAIAIGPYTAAAIPNGRRTPDDLFAPRHLAELGKVVEQVLAAEAPMHVDLLARRVGGYFGIGRVTQRVTDQVKVALSGRGRSGEEADIVWRLDQDPEGVPPVRVAGQGATARREILEVPLSELASAARIVVERANGIAPNDLIRDAARLLGFARITEEVVARVTLAVRLAAARELIRIADNKAQLPVD